MRIAFIGDSLTRGIPGSSYVEILRQELPQHTLFNLGRGNDTVISLYRRISRHQFDELPFDIAFLWVGVNDADENVKFFYRLFNALRRQPRAKTPQKFRIYYRKALDIVCRHAEHVIAVSPLLKGEDIDNIWNRRLTLFSAIIEDLASQRPAVAYLDLRSIVFPRLENKPISDYLLDNPFRVGLDILLLHTDAQVDRKAAKRGLHFTLDGIHLNSKGARLVAHAFLDAIRSQEKAPATGRGSSLVCQGRPDADVCRPQRRP